MDPTGYLAVSAIMNGFSVATTEQLLNLFQVGGVLQGKWGYLKFLTEAGPVSYKLWKETGKDYEFWQKNTILRKNLLSHPCRNDIVSQLSSDKLCFTEGYKITTGKFTAGINPKWQDEYSSGSIDLLTLGLLNADWYVGDSGEPDTAWYAYEKYPVVIGYNWSNVNKMSLSSNIASFISPCVLTCGVAPGNPLCIAGAIASIYAFAGGTVSTVSEMNKVSSGNLDSMGNVSLGFCSSLPVVGALCGAAGATVDIQGGAVYMEYK
jgi:hypothetical protein